MDFWLDKVTRQSRIPYPIFFGLMALLLYLLGIPFMIFSDNLQTFLSEPRWILIAIFNALNGILVIFVFRKFSDSLTKIKQLLGSDYDFNMLKDRLQGYLTHKVYWIIVGFWFALKLLHAPQMIWWQHYNQPQLITVYEFIEMAPSCLIGGIFMYMIPIGLTLAYRNLCLKTSFKKEILHTRWMKPFNGFKTLITLTMFGAVVYAIFPPNIWGSTPEPTTTTYWFIYIPYAGVAIVLASVVLFPHYYFHKLFTKVKENRILDFQRELSKVSTRKVEGTVRRILLLLEEERVEKMKTWLLDIKILGEVIVVALMHVILVEALTIFMHG